MTPKPAAGTTVKFTVVGSNSADIEGGTYTLDVEFLGIPITNESGDLCDASSGQLSVDCPVKAAPSTSIEGNFEIPDSAPAGDYAITIAAKDKASKDIFCVEIDFTLDDAVKAQAYLRSE